MTAALITKKELLISQIKGELWKAYKELSGTGRSLLINGLVDKAASRMTMKELTIWHENLKTRKTRSAPGQSKEPNKQN